MNGALNLLIPQDGTSPVFAHRNVCFTYLVQEMADKSFKVSRQGWKRSIYGSDVEAALGLAFAKSLRKGEEPEDENAPPWDTVPD